MALVPATTAVSTVTHHDRDEDRTDRDAAFVDDVDDVVDEGTDKLATKMTRVAKKARGCED